MKLEPLPTSLSTQILSSSQFDELLGQDWPKSSPFSCERSRLPPGEIPQESLAVLSGDADVELWSSVLHDDLDTTGCESVIAFIKFIDARYNEPVAEK